MANDDANDIQTPRRPPEPNPEGGPVARSRLVRELRGLGLEPGGVVMVHCRMSALGHVVGGAETIVRALLEATAPDGTLMAYTGWQDEPPDDLGALGEEDYIEHIARSALAAGAGKEGAVGEGAAYLLDARGLVEHAVGWIERNFAPKRLDGQ